MYGRSQIVRPVQTKVADQNQGMTIEPMPPGETEDTRIAQGHHEMGQYDIFPQHKRKKPVQREEGPAASNSGKVPGAEPASAGKPLPEGFKQQMEHSFGENFDDVRLHEDGAAASIGATAYTQDTNIHGQPGKIDVNSESGKKTLGHELAHVVQQRHGQVAVPQGKGLPINADQHLEKEADTLGERAVRGEQVQVAGAPPRHEQ
ncbi:MAG: DUF4157 domain-containing protein [Acidobacteriota bacterium]|nr:DUF4157 domain-containing protein [Acidobacteriota bacterium]